MCHEMERDSFIKKHLNFPAILYVPPFGFYQCENCQVGEKTFSLEIQITDSRMSYWLEEADSKVNFTKPSSIFETRLYLVHQ